MNFVGSILLSVGTMIGAVGIEPGSSPPTRSFFEPVQPPRAVKVMARQGAQGQAPPNTIRALDFSIGDTVEWAEVDVRTTRDGHHVLFHDESLDGSGKLKERTLEEIERIELRTRQAKQPVREAIPTLKNVLEHAHNKINLKVNCLDIDPARLVREVIDANMQNQVMISGTRDDIEKIRAGAGHDLAVITRWETSDGFTSWVERIGPTAVEVDASQATAEVCQEFHRRGIRVLVSARGNSDRKENWVRAIDNHADWILTDLAEEVLAMMSLKAIGTMPIKMAIHRGAGRYAPENTLPAFEKALRLGADFIEFDVQTTRTGVSFLMHDAKLNRTTSGTGPLKDADEATIRSLDAGSWFGERFAGTKIPSLDEFFDAVGNRSELYFDAKDITPEALAESLRRHGLVERAVVYQGVDYLAKLRAIAPEIRRMPPLRDSKTLDQVAEKVQPYAFDTRWSLLSRETIAACHAKGIKVFSDSIGMNETIAKYQRAIRDGIDVIQTDHPVRLLRAIELESANLNR